MKKTSMWIAVAVTGLTQGAFLLSQGARPDFARAAPVTLAAPAPDAYRVDAQSARELQDKITAAATAVQQALTVVSALEAPPATLKTAVVEAGQRMENAQAGLTQKQKAEANGEKIGNNARVLLDRQRTGHYLLDALNATDVRLQEATEGLGKLARPLPAGVNEAIKTAGARVQEALVAAQSDFDALDAKIDDKTKAQMREWVAALASADAALKASKEADIRGAQVAKFAAEVDARAEQSLDEIHQIWAKEKAEDAKREEDKNREIKELEEYRTRAKVKVQEHKKELTSLLSRFEEAKTKEEKQKAYEDLKAFIKKQGYVPAKQKGNATATMGRKSLPNRNAPLLFSLSIDEKRYSPVYFQFVQVDCEELRLNVNLFKELVRIATETVVESEAKLAAAEAAAEKEVKRLIPIIESAQANVTLMEGLLRDIDNAIGQIESQIRAKNAEIEALEADAATASATKAAADRALENFTFLCGPNPTEEEMAILALLTEAARGANAAYETAVDRVETAVRQKGELLTQLSNKKGARIPIADLLTEYKETLAALNTQKTNAYNGVITAEATLQEDKDNKAGLQDGLDRANEELANSGCN